MRAHELYSELKALRISSSHFFGRKLYVVRYADFEKYLPHFSETKNIFSPKKNYRTKEAFKHIHAVRTGDLVEFHLDFGNLYVSPLMALPHLVFDVLPYFVWHLISLKKPYSLDTK